MHASHRRNYAFFESLYVDLRPDLEKILRRYEIPSADADWLLEEVVLELIYKGESSGRPAEWLKATLRGKCRRYWVEERRKFFVTVADPVRTVASLTGARS